MGATVLSHRLEINGRIGKSTMVNFHLYTRIHCACHFVTKTSNTMPAKNGAFGSRLKGIKYMRRC